MVSQLFMNILCSVAVALMFPVHNSSVVQSGGRTPSVRFLHRGQMAPVVSDVSLSMTEFPERFQDLIRLIVKCTQCGRTASAF